MPKQKYNYIKLKAEFLKSDFDEVKGFITDKGLRYNSERAKRTKGWAKEKQEIDEKALAKATQNVLAKQTAALEIPMEQLTIAKKNAVVKVIQKMMGNDLDMTDMERAIRILRTEMGLPNSYAKNENTNIDRIEGIHIVLGGNPIEKNKGDEEKI